MPKSPLIILDRDGVINFESSNYIKSPDEWQPIPGSLQAIVRLKNAGFTVCVATNQSGVARGLYTLEILGDIHAKLENALAALGVALDAIHFCPHRDEDQCECRKPKPGMLLAIAKQFSVASADCIFIGDSARDIQAAQACGMPGVMLSSGYGEKQLAAHPGLNVPVFADLQTFVDEFLEDHSVTG